MQSVFIYECCIKNKHTDRAAPSICNTHMTTITLHTLNTTAHVHNVPKLVHNFVTLYPLCITIIPSQSQQHTERDYVLWFSYICTLYTVQSHNTIYIFYDILYPKPTKLWNTYVYVYRLETYICKVVYTISCVLT